MSHPNVVSIHPYFKVHPGQLAAFKAALPAFVEKTTGEPANLYYEFTSHGTSFSAARLMWARKGC